MPSAGEAFAENVRAAIDQIEANLPGAIRGRDPEFLHQLRVGMRRLRSTLRSFRKLVRRRRWDAIDRPLRAQLRALGAARDWDVFCKATWAPVLQREAERRRLDARQAAQATMRSKEFRDAMSATRALAEGEPWRKHADPDQPLLAFACGALQRLHGKLRAAAAGIDWSDDVRRHRVRIRVKRVRYGTECFAPAFREGDVQRFLGQVKGLQEILGQLNDNCVQKRLLRKLGRGRGRGAAARSALARLEGREDLLRRGMSAAWRKFETHARFWRHAEAARDAGRTPSRGR